MKVNNIKLNFLDNYYMFYEWLDTDNIEIIDNINIYRIPTDNLNDLYEYKIRVLDESIIKNNTVILSDTFNFIAVEFDENGYSMYKSSLLLEDEVKLYDIVDSLKEINIIYTKVEKEKRENDLRINMEIKKLIQTEVNTLKENNNIEKLKYLYYEWFDKKENDISKIINNMNKRLKSPLNSKDVYIYDLIKRSYKLV